ncbi:transmembrane protein 72 [Sceloporus undulatus]|uniref:transmembrane protein 72 n=1 Tax=Sceloporus undulatus TaxID=8520 RepID=UPI001C4DBBFA|nr:transmembrane protein 72 [Sceloporus undulatus]XP_042316444.1 transmembrane protein 72 [Sceloporus undulatus]
MHSPSAILNSRILKDQRFARMRQMAFWNVLEYLCRFLGMATGTVLIVVGTETLLQGQFRSLAVYLLISGIAVLVCEAAYFVSLLLAISSIPKIGSMKYICWKQARRRGAYQKFLAYVLLSLACFLHPVIVWHVTIPGTMLVVTGLVYYLLSKQKKKPTENGQEQCSDPYDGVVVTADTDDIGRTYTFCREVRKGKHSFAVQDLKNIFKGYKKEEIVTTDSSTILFTKRQTPLEEKVVNIILSVGENSEEPEKLADEITSDTALILNSQL